MGGQIMKIKLSQINVGKFIVREELDKEYLKEIKASLKDDGQWNPIIVKPSDDKKGYDLIAGHTRFQAVKELGWKEIEATVKDLSDEDADVLSLKTNLMRKTMNEVEEGKVLQRYINRYGLSQEEMGKKLGKSPDWVSKRLSLVMKVSKYVTALLLKGKLTAWQAARIASIESEAEQNEFADYLVENKIPSGRPTEQALKRFKNRTIFTIGYEGRDIDDFVEVLKKNEIVVLIDARQSAESKHKPEFNGKILARSLKQNNIVYEHHPELGVPYELQEPYKSGDFTFECLETWYRWHIKNNVEFTKLIEHIKDVGKPALMCMERHAMAQRKQKYHCHRHILANMVNETSLFPERIDI